MSLNRYDATFKLGDVEVTDEDRSHKIPVTDEERTQNVRVYWDINKAPIPWDYPIANLKKNITTALHHVDPDLKIDYFLGVGDTTTLKDQREQGDDGIEFIHTTERDLEHQCSICKRTNPLPKIDAPNCTLIKAMLGDVADRDSQGIILLITGDCDYSPTLTLLMQKEMKILLAQGRQSDRKFRLFAHLTWYWDMMMEGKEPTFYLDG